MLIYNHKKEFIGINESDLHSLGLENMAQLEALVDDFADCFVKTPGHVHNFVHVSWIDFVRCAEPTDKPRAIINIRDVNYTCILDVEIAYFKENPTEQTYLVHLQNLSQMGENEKINSAKFKTPNIPVKKEVKPKPQKTVEPLLDVKSEEPLMEAKEEKLDDSINLDLDDMFSKKVTEKKELKPIILEDKLDLDLDLDLSLDLEEDLTPVKKVEELKVEKTIEPKKTIEKKIEQIKRPIQKAKIKIKPKPIVKKMSKVAEEYAKSTYKFDPQLASDELGLPVDLIEEFIEDFVAQALEFKDGLYSSIAERDLDTIKSQSHKLKGVAANLRIEDALEVLTTANHSEDFVEIQDNLDVLYKIIAKLNGEEIEDEIMMEEPIEENSLELDFQEETTNEDSLELTLNLDEDNHSSDDSLELNLDEEETLELDLNLEENNIKNEDSLDLNEDSVDNIESLELDLNLDENNNDDTELDSLELNLDIEEDKPLELNLDDNKNIEPLELNLDIEDEPLELDLKLDTEEDNSTIESLELDIEEPLELNLIEEEFENNDIVVTYNKATASREIGIPEDMFEELFTDYLEDAKSILGKLIDAVDSNETEKLKAEAIKLKGMSDNMRVLDLKSDIDTLINMDDNEMAKKAVKNIEKFLLELSK